MPPKEAAPPLGSGGTKKIFIYELDGYVGKVLGEFAKHRGFAEGETPIICGSLIDPRNKPTWADEVIRKDDLLGLKKALLSSDIIVYDVASTPKEATSALKVLLKYDYAENPEEETDKVMIGVSNLLSWYNNKVPVLAEGEEPAPGDDRVLSSEDAPERKPHDNYKAQVTVENLIINKGNCKKDRLKTYVVWAGLLYGCGEGVLHSLFRCSWLPPEEVGADDALSLRRAWRTEKKLPFLGAGNNKIPMIHVSDLAGMVLELAKRAPTDIKSVLAVDKGQTTLAGCVQAISKALQSGEVMSLDQNQYLQFMTDFEEPHVNSLLLQLNMKMSLLNGEVLGYGEEDVTWVAKTGFIENIERVVEEYRKWRNLQPVRVLFYGPPSLMWYPMKQSLPEGQFLEPEERLSLAKEFAQEYQVTCIDIEQIKEEFKPKEPEEGAEPEPERTLIEMLQLKMQQPLCRNQGFVLNNFPTTREDAAALFDCDIVPAEGEEPPEEGEPGEGKPPKAPLPQTVLNISVNVPDPAVPPPPAEGEELVSDGVPMGEKIKAAKLEAFTKVITARLALLHEKERELEPPVENIEQWLTENGLDEEGQQLGCLGLFMTQKPKAAGEEAVAAPSKGGPGRQMCEQIVDIIADYDLDFIQDKIRLSIGDPRNYDPSKPRREREAKARALAEAKAAAAAAAKKAEEEASRSEREAKAKMDADRLAKLQEEERQALLLRSQPMRKYLMDNVLPSLTRGLQEVAKVRPDDPVDYLAEYLFNLDPQMA
jgi:adenylate kinase